MDYTSLFYWLVVADNARGMFLGGLIFFAVVFAVAFIWFLIANPDGHEEDNYQIRKRLQKWCWWSGPLFFLFCSLYVFTPSKRDALLIVAGGSTMNFLSNDDSAKEIPKELSSFLLVEIKNMAADAKVDLGIADQKQRFLEEAKKMSSDELLKRIKTDTTFAKIYLNQE